MTSSDKVVMVLWWRHEERQDDILYNSELLETCRSTCAGHKMLIIQQLIVSKLEMHISRRDACKPTTPGLLDVGSMSNLAYDVIIWLEVAYRNPAKTSMFGPYANSGLDKLLIREQLYEIGGEHVVNKLSEGAINRALNESPNFDGIHGLSCHDTEGNICFTIFVKRETNAAVAGKLRTPSEYSTLTLYCVQVTDWWPKIHLDTNGSLEDVIKERLHDDGIRLQKNDLFET